MRSKMGGMKVTLFEGYTVGEVERGIPFPVGHKKLLSIEQKQFLKLKDGESFVLAVHFDEFPTDNAERLMQWARESGIYAIRRQIDDNSVQICRVGPLLSTAKGKRKK